MRPLVCETPLFGLGRGVMIATIPLRRTISSMHEAPT